MYADGASLILDDMPASYDLSNAALQAPPIAGATQERRLLAVACKRWLGVGEGRDTVLARLFTALLNRYPPLLLQLLLQLVEEAPVGALGHELLGAGLDHPELMQT